MVKTLKTPNIPVFLLQFRLFLDCFTAEGILQVELILVLTTPQPAPLLQQLEPMPVPMLELSSL